MSNILFVNACVRPQSRTLKLAKHVLSKLNGDVQEVNLEKENIQAFLGLLVIDLDQVLILKDPKCHKP